MFDLYWWLTAAALFAGCVIQTALGFGMAVIAAPIIVLFRPEWVPAILTMVALVLSLQNSWNQRHSIEWRHMAPAFVFRIPGTLVGAWILTLLNVQLLQILVAGMVFMAIFVTAFARPFPATPRNLSIASFLSGIAGTTTSVGGPPMALVMQHGASHNTRANLSLYFAFSCTVSLISYQAIGLLNSAMWLTGFTFVPVAFAGFYIGKLARAWVDDRFRPLLLILCSVSALIALAGALTHT